MSFEPKKIYLHDPHGYFEVESGYLGGKDMKHEEFMLRLEQYYGEYPDAVRVTVWDYVFGCIDESDSEEIMDDLKLKDKIRVCACSFRT